MTQTTTKAGERTQHTPGLWSYSPSVDSFVIRGGEYQTHIAQTYLRGEDDKANARLIAAAPELLAAARQVEAHSHVNADGNYTVDVSAMDAICAAIAKAEGRAQ